MVQYKNGLETFQNVDINGKPTIVIRRQTTRDTVMRLKR